MLRILIVDDEALIRWSLAETLAAAGHAIVEAGDGEGALAELERGEEFDVVLLDFRLPDSNDLQLLATIRRIASKTAVIMMTAYSTPELTNKALDLGAYCVVPKPFEVHDMTELVLQAHVASRNA